MFQKPLHFDRNGVRVVAMCPGRTITDISDDERTFLVAEWKKLAKGHVFQTYALQHILINYKPLIQPLRKSYLNIYPWVFMCGNNTSWKQFVCCKCSAHAHTNWYSHMNLILYLGFLCIIYSDIQATDNLVFNSRLHLWDIEVTQLISIKFNSIIISLKLQGLHAKRIPHNKSACIFFFLTLKWRCWYIRHTTIQAGL